MMRLSLTMAYAYFGSSGTASRQRCSATPDRQRPFPAAGQLLYRRSRQHTTDNCTSCAARPLCCVALSLAESLLHRLMTGLFRRLEEQGEPTVPDIKLRRDSMQTFPLGWCFALIKTSSTDLRLLCGQNKTLASANKPPSAAVFYQEVSDWRHARFASTAPRSGMSAANLLMKERSYGDQLFQCFNAVLE